MEKEKIEEIEEVVRTVEIKEGKEVLVKQRSAVIPPPEYIDKMAVQTELDQLDKSDLFLQSQLNLNNSRRKELLADIEAFN